MGDVIMLGDFNAHTGSLQIPLHDCSEDVFFIQETYPDTVGLHWSFDDVFGPLTEYGRHLL